MKKNPELTARTRANLMEAFWSLYSTRKIEQITISQITTKAGYNRSTFYEYFIDIYDVLYQLENDLLTYIKQTVVKGNKKSFRDDIIETAFDIYEGRGTYLSVLLTENGDPSFAEKMKATVSPVMIEAFDLSPEDIHTYYILEFALSAVIATMSHWYKTNKSLNITEVGEMVESMLRSGVLPLVKKYSVINK